jgi:glycosyltransferase involved in cell wall biosynthesis
LGKNAPAAADTPIVWLVSATLEPRGSSFYTLRLARHLADFGFKPVIVCESDQILPPRVRESVDVIVVPRLRYRFFRTLGLRPWARETDAPPALVHSQRLTMESIGQEIADAFDVPHLLTVHNALGPDVELDATLEDFAAVIAVSPSVQKSIMIRQGANESLVQLIPSGVDVPSMPRLPPPRDPDRVPVVGTASVLEPSKGILYFLMAAELILSSGHDVEFVVAGTGPDEEFLRQTTRHLDIANRVTFAPHVTSFSQIIDTFDVFVLPSLDQGLGSIMLEALALGKPVVATRVGGVGRQDRDAFGFSREGAQACRHRAGVRAAEFLRRADGAGHCRPLPTRPLGRCVAVVRRRVKFVELGWSGVDP